LDDELKKLQGWRTSFLNTNNLKNTSSKPAAPEPFNDADTSSEHYFDNDDNINEDSNELEAQLPASTPTKVVENNQKVKIKLKKKPICRYIVFYFLNTRKMNQTMLF
jgi:cytoskeletal protein RodZ